MFHHLKGVISPQTVRRVVELTQAARFVDGRRTNVGHSAKRNLQVPTDDPRNDEPAALIRQGLASNKQVHAIVRAKGMSRATFSRYEPGMAYGDHVDEGIFPSQPPMRADVSCTVFLNAPADYQGGELVVQAGNQEHRVKGEAGDVVLYPSTTVHRVEPVSRGVRLVAVAWFQSLVRDQHRREVLYQLQSVLDELILKELDAPLAVRLSYVQANLLRMWAEP